MSSAARAASFSVTVARLGRPRSARRTKRPAHAVSSSERCPSLPAQTMATSNPRPSAARTEARTPEKLTYDPTMTSRAVLAAAARARVPFVVVVTITRPRTAAGVYSSGELPRLKPAIRTAFRSPARRALPTWAAARRAAAMVATGMTAVAPLCSAVAMEVLARSTSMTTARCEGGSADGSSVTVSLGITRPAGGRQHLPRRRGGRGGRCGNVATAQAPSAPTFPFLSVCPLPFFAFSASLR